MRILSGIIGSAALCLVLSCGWAAAQTAEDFFSDAVLHEVRLYTHPNDWTTLKRDYLDDGYYPADFEWKFQGRTIALPNVYIRSRGTGSRSDVKPGLRVDIDRESPGRRFLGLKSFILRNHTQDASLIHERLAMVLFRRLGIPAPRGAHARLYVNDEYIGLYSIVESVDKAFLRENYKEDDGYLYKYEYAPNRVPYYFEYRGSDPSLYSPIPFQPETHEQDPDPRPIAAMIGAINQSSDSEFVERVSEYLDLKQFMAHVAIERFLAEFDGVIGAVGMNNFFLYRLEKRNLSRLIPWDKSHAFGSGPEESIWRFITDVPPDQENRLMRRAMKVPELRAAYLSTLARCAAATGGDGGFLLREIERAYEQIRDSALADKNKQCLDARSELRPCSNEEFEAAIESVKDFARRRSRIVLEEVSVYLEASSDHPYSFSGREGVSQTTLGVAESAGAGYARLQPSAGSETVSGLAIFGLRQNEVLVTEAGVPAAASIQGGRVYAEVDGATSTGLAIANVNKEPVTISFFFTDLDGKDFGHGTAMLPAGSQVARFLDESPFNGTIPIRGSFTFMSTLPVAALALRSFVNERSESLVTTLPVVELGPGTRETVTIPHFADGAGWSTLVVLVNPTDSPQAGTMEFYDQGSALGPAQPLQVTVAGATASSFAYSLSPRSSRVFGTSGDSDQARSGSVRILPASGSTAPVPSEIFSYRRAGITVTQAGVTAAAASTGFNLYVETLGTAGEVGAIDTGLAIANPAAEAVTVELELSDLSGNSLGSASLSIPGRGQIAKFLSQIEEFTSPASPVQGILRITTASPAGVAAVGLRGRYNERDDFLITTMPPVDERSPDIPSGELFFPHLVDGGGYTTRFVLFGGQTGSAVRGTLRFVSHDGSPLSLALW